MYSGNPHDDRRGELEPAQFVLDNCKGRLAIHPTTNLVSDGGVFAMHKGGIEDPGRYLPGSLLRLALALTLVPLDGFLFQGFASS